MELTSEEKAFVIQILQQVTLPANQGHLAVEIAKKIQATIPQNEVATKEENLEK